MNPQPIRLHAYGDEVITRMLVREEEGVVLVCQAEELDRARIERRDPRLVGFPRRDVLGE